MDRQTQSPGGAHDLVSVSFRVIAVGIIQDQQAAVRAQHACCFLQVNFCKKRHDEIRKNVNGADEVELPIRESSQIAAGTSQNEDVVVPGGVLTSQAQHP